MKKECPNKGMTFTSKSTFSNVEKCEHYGVEGHDIDNYYSLHPKLHPTRSTTSKDVKAKEDVGEAMVFNPRQSRRKILK